MAHTFTTVRLHVVFSTEGRKRLLPPELQPRVWDYIGGIGRNHRLPIHEVGGTSNHVHILMSLSPTITIAKSVQTVKAFSSKWLNEIKAMKNGRFAWQEGYSAFSVSQSNMPVVAKYIRNQAEHHGKHTFEDELRSLLHRHEIAFNDHDLFG